MINSIVSFSNKPLVFILNAGFLITLFSVIYILKLLIDRLFYNIGIDGWTSVVVSIWFFGGLIIFMLGILGLYISKIFIEVKQRPYTIIKKIYEGDKDE